MSKITLNLGLNSTSLGQISWSIARELYSRGEQVNIFPIGQVDAASQKPDNDFFAWIQESINRAPIEHSRKNPIIKNWHIDGSLESFSDRQILVTYYECSAPTEYELNVVRNNDTVFIPSKYAVEKFRNAGTTNVNHIDLFFDSVHFSTKPEVRQQNRVEWMICGKFEHRKRTAKTIQAWLKKYGNNPNHCLNLAINNNFIQPEVFQKILLQVFGGQRWWNVNLIPWVPSSEDFNKVLNHPDIFIAMSGGESNDTLNMHGAALGKHIICLNAHGYQDWANSENAILVEPSGMIPVDDGMFFQTGRHTNQGNFFDYSEEDLFEAFGVAENHLKACPVNTKGFELQNLTVGKTVDKLLNCL